MRVTAASRGRPPTGTRQLEELKAQQRGGQSLSGSQQEGAAAGHGNASKAFHRRGVTQPSRATRGHQPRAARRSSSQLAARSAAQHLAAQRSGSQRRPATAPSSSRSPQRRPKHHPDRAATVKEVDRPGLLHQRVPSADQQGRVNHLHNHRLTSTSRTPSPVLHHPPQQTPPEPVR